MPVLQYAPEWSGARIGRGASVFHFEVEGDGTSPAQGAASAVRNFFEAIKAFLPLSVAVAYPQEAKVFTEDGVLTNVVPVSAGGTTQGTGTAVWLNGAGGCIRWNTGEVAGGRRVIGRTFIVPMVADAATAGNFKSTTITTFGVAIDGLINGTDPVRPPLGVWSKKNGVIAEVTTGSLLARPSSLRTRNDR